MCRRHHESVCEVRLDDPPKELTEGVLGIPFVIGSGEVAVLTFGGIFPGVSYVVLDVGTSKLCVKYWGSEREYEWRPGRGNSAGGECSSGAAE